MTHHEPETGMFLDYGLLILTDALTAVTAERMISLQV